MKKIYFLTLMLLIPGCCLFANGDKGSHKPTQKEQEQFPKQQSGNGLRFTPNKGQIANMDGKLCHDVLYKGDGGGADIYLRKTGLSYVYSNMAEITHKINEQVEQLIITGTITEADEREKKDELMKRESIKIHRVDMDFAGSNENISTTNEDEADGYQNFYYAHCPNGILNVKQYNKVIYKNIYDNIDVTYYGDKEHGIKYDLIVQPHADPNQIKLHWKGAESIRINREGNLVIKTSVNEFTESIPKVYQNINGKIVDIKTEYKLTHSPSGKAGDLPAGQAEALINFSFSTFDPSFPLIIDPWATYYGGNAIDHSSSIATDNTGNVFITGRTQSLANIPSGTGFQTIYGGGSWDAFVVKFNGSTGARLWATYYGGTGDESNYFNDRTGGIATDALGNVFIAGTTTSTAGIASTSGIVGFQTTHSGGSYDAFLVKFNGAGARLWSTYYGGTGADHGNGLATDVVGNVYMAGNTQSNSGIAAGGFQNILSGGNDAFLVKFNSASGGRIWATYYGGTGWDEGFSVATDASGNVYMAGDATSTTGIATPTGFQNVYGGGIADAFLVKFNGSGARLWGTYYGGLGDEDDCSSVTTDAVGDVYLAGWTTSNANIATPGGFQTTYGGGAGDAFLVKFNGSGTRLWATYYGSSYWEYSMPGNIATDQNNNVFILLEAEDTQAPNLADACAWQPAFGGVEDQLIVKFSPLGKKICATYMGGTGHDDLDDGGGIAIYDNSLYITGWTDGGYPVTNGAAQTIYGGGSRDAFVSSICTNICEGKTPGLDYTANTTIACVNSPVTFAPTIIYSCDTSGYKYSWTFTGGTPATSLLSKPSVTYNTPGTYSVKLVLSTYCKKDSVIKTNYITVNPCTINASALGTTICPNTCANITASGSGGTLPYTYNWNTGATTPTINVCPIISTTYSVTVTDANGSTAAVAPSIIIQPAILLGTSFSNISCGKIGRVSIDFSSGVIPFTYSWSNGQTTPSISYITAGGYTVTVTDGNGCTQTKTFNITGVNPVSATFTNPPACVGKQVCFTNTGSTGTYTWYIYISSLLSPIAFYNTANFCYTFSTAGPYNIRHIVNNAGCQNWIEKEIIVTDCTGPKITATGSSACAGLCATVTSTGSGGTAPYTYSWSNGASTQNISACPALTTTYTVTIKDAGGNTSTSTAVATVNPAVTATIASTNIMCNGGTGSATATGTSGTSPYTYNWNTSGTGFQISGLTAGTYTVTVTDNKGCTGISTATIISPQPLAGQFAKGTANCTACACKEWIMVNATGGTSPYSYTWPDGYVNRYKNHLCPGTYTIAVKDKNGCSININLAAP